MKGDEFRSVRKHWSDWKYVMKWIESELDKKITSIYSWRAHKPCCPTTTMLVAALIPAAKNNSSRTPVPSMHSVLTVCKNLRILEKEL